ncbi:MAG: hydroxymethylbilane synthase [Candidatus Binataceae bacterium]
MSLLTLRIGSRPSTLAMTQARIVEQSIRAVLPDVVIEIKPIRTSGDRMTAASLADIGGKGLFIKELESALADRRIDLAVHSMKDLPARLSSRFRIAATPPRQDPRDVMIPRDIMSASDGGGLDALAPGARLGTSSPRRRFQALSARPDLEIIPMRGNVDTRLAKLAAGPCDAIILAMAGLVRLGRAAESNLTMLDERKFVPAGGQGALALETIADLPLCGSPELENALRAINDPRCECETAAEREFLAVIGASCVTPIGVKATLEGKRLTVRALLFAQNGERSLADELEVVLEKSALGAVAAGAALGHRMLERGAAELIGNG